MLLYTVVPPEAVMSQQAPARQTEYLRGGGGLVEAVRGEDGELRVGRLISTDPRAYLDRRYSPGQPYRQ